MTHILRGSLIAVALIVVAMTACSRHGSVSSALAPPSDGDPRFTIALTDATGLPIESARDKVSLVAQQVHDGYLVTALIAEPAPPLGADLYARLTYDDSRWHPVDFAIGDAWGSEARVVSLAVLDAGSPLPIGISLLKPYRDEAVRAGKLFSVQFAPGPNDSTKLTAHAPGDANRLAASEVDMTVDGLAVTFNWLEKNRGDYNRDGTVAIGDITPLAAHFNESVEDSPGNDVIDGNGDGALTISDITPIAANFGSSIAGYRLWRSDKEEGAYLPNWDDPGHPEVSASRPDPATSPPGRLPYTYTDTAPDDTVFYRLYPYGDGEVGAASDDLYPFAGGPTDTTPPVWESDIGIVSLEKVTSPSVQLRFTFGKATDADTPPVRYRVYWQEGSLLDWATAHTRDFTSFSPDEPAPYARSLGESDGIQGDKDYAVGVRAFDSASPANFTTNANYLTTAGGPVDTTPPEWVDAEGISHATAGDGQVTITWGEATDADSPPVVYLVYYAESAVGIDWEAPAEREVTAPATNTTITELTNGVEYEFGVRARDSAPTANSTRNTNTLTATPEHVETPYPFGTPPQGFTQIGTDQVNDTDIAIDGSGNPAIVAVNSFSTLGLNLYYYDDAAEDWTSVNIAATDAFYHPQILLVGGKILVAAFDQDAGELRLYKGNAEATDWPYEVIDNSLVECYALSMDYSPVTDRIGMAGGFAVDPNPDVNQELHYYSRPLDGGESDWTTNTVENDQEEVVDVSLAMHPVSGLPSIAYSSGIYWFTGMQYDFEELLRFATCDAGGQWSIETLLPQKIAEAIALAFDPIADEPVITFAQTRFINYHEQDVPVTDASVAEHTAQGWSYTTVDEGSFDVEGFTLITVFSGADPTIEFFPDGTAVWGFVRVQADYDVISMTFNIASSLFQASRLGNWQLPQPLWADGASADALALGPGSTVQYSFVQIPILHDGPTRNHYPIGDLAYFRQ